MFTHKKHGGPTQLTPLTAHELRNHILNMNAFLGPIQSKLTLETLPDGSNHLIIAAAHEVDNDSVISVIRLLMAQIYKKDFLYQVIEEKESDFAGYTVATAAAKSTNKALQTIFQCLPDLVGENFKDEQQTLANYTVPQGPYKGYSMVHFTAGSRRNLEELDLHNADLCRELPDECKGDQRSHAKWTVLDLAIEKWASKKVKTEKNVFTDVMDYYLARVREKTKTPLSSIIDSIHRKHSSYLTDEQLKEIIAIIQKGYHSAPYVRLSASLIPQRRAKRKTEVLKEPEKAKIQKKYKQTESAATSSIPSKKVKKDSPQDLAPPATLSSHAVLALSLSTDLTQVEAKAPSQPRQDEKLQIEKLHAENAGLKKSLEETRAQLATLQSALAEKEKENSELRLKLDARKKDPLAEDTESNSFNEMFAKFTASRLAATQLPDTDIEGMTSSNEDMPSLFTPRSR